jgi:RNase P subunit RPR2
MKTRYLHLSAYFCDKCAGPVVAGSTAVRANGISKETDFQPVGAICLTCGHRQIKASNSGFTHDFPPTQWDLPKRA